MVGWGEAGYIGEIPFVSSQKKVHPIQMSSQFVLIVLICNYINNYLLNVFATDCNISSAFNRPRQKWFDNNSALAYKCIGGGNRQIDQPAGAEYNSKLFAKKSKDSRSLRGLLLHEPKKKSIQENKIVCYFFSPSQNSLPPVCFIPSEQRRYHTYQNLSLSSKSYPPFASLSSNISHTYVLSHSRYI